MSIGIAFRAFFAALLNKQAADRIRVALADTPSAIPSRAADSTPISATKLPGSQRSEALTLISALQREARFLDLVQEPLEGYTDAQVGVAARDVLRDAAKTLQRFFAIKKLIDSPEGDSVELPKDPSAARWRIIGPTPSGSRATLIHSGWLATQCNVPQWTGLSEDALILAPAEVEA